MTDFQAKQLSFARLNGVLGNSTPPIPYCWSESEVFLKSDRSFDENAYLESKVALLLGRETILTEANIRRLFQKVVDQNSNVLTDLQNCHADMFGQYDSKFNLLLEAAFGQAENERNLRNSKENIRNSMQNTDGWMNVDNVNHLVRLTTPPPPIVNPPIPTNPNKFVPKGRP